MLHQLLEYYWQDKETVHWVACERLLNFRMKMGCDQKAYDHDDEPEYIGIYAG